MNRLVLSLSALTLSAPKEGEPRKVSAVVYTGKTLSYGGYDIAIDLGSLQKMNKGVPILHNHSRERHVGFGSLSREANNLLINGQMLDNAHAAEIISAADQGFKWQMSIHIESGHIVDVAAGSEVNGMTIDRDVKLYMNGLIREVSFTPTGVDDDTNAAILSLSLSPETPANNHLEEKNTMEKELKEQLAAKENEIATLTAKIDVLEKTIAQQKTAERVKQLSLLGIEEGRALKLSKADDETFAELVQELKAIKGKKDLYEKQEAVLGASYPNAAEPKAANPFVEQLKKSGVI